MFNLQEILVDINSNAIKAIDAINKSKAYIALIVDEEMSLLEQLLMEILEEDY